MNEPIYVTKPTLPPLAEVLPYLEQIWNSRQLTNQGIFHQQLEAALCEYLGIQHISLFANGTLALVTALQTLRITGEVITTPFSFVATAHSLLWNGITPVFVDIDTNTLNLDPNKIEAAITPRTSAILPVHVYGQPCDIKLIQEIANIYNLKIIYDAAHAFGVEDNEGSLLQYGDLSILSFHATKVFTTFEGGAIISPDKKTKTRIDYLKNFGFADEITVMAPGINGKMNEFQAAVGLVQLKYIDAALTKRQNIDAQYRSMLNGVDGIRCLNTNYIKRYNYSYFPIIIEPKYHSSRDDIYAKLKSQNIHARRYFYPLISNFPMYRNLPSASYENLPNATKAAISVLCLPIYPDLDPFMVEKICQSILEK
ncbi:aminotransferase [Achromatium sp. WMS2]|nr:aminotransferase [Achromatium sp. WMS2]